MPEVRRIYNEIENMKPVQMGFMASHILRSDPKHLAFTAARYKFVAKMLEGKTRVLEVGAGDGFFSVIVKQHVKEIVLTDAVGRDGIQARDLMAGPFYDGFDGGYCLDVLEHIDEEYEGTFLENFKQSVSGPVIVGMPSIESQVYASEYSRQGHVNCKTKEGLRLAMKRHFQEVFMFSMNDEVIHTGIMANYWLAVGL